MNEPFLINPIGRKMRKNPLMVINPKGLKLKKLKKLKKTKKPKVIFSTIATPHRSFRILPERFQRRKIKKVSQRRQKMAKKFSGTKRRLTVYGKKGRVRISPSSRLVKRSRGRLLNPKGILMSTGLSIGDLFSIAGGGIVVRFLPNVIPLPPALRTGAMRIAVQGGLAVGVGLLVGKVLKQNRLGKMLMVGGLVSTAINAIDLFVLRGRLASDDLEAFLDPAEVPLEEGDVSAYLPETEVSAFLPEDEVSEIIPETEVGVAEFEDEV